MLPLWKQRYYAAGISSAQIASAAPQRGLVSCARSGASQLYAWVVPTGELRCLTDRPMGIRDGVISGNGQSVIYFNDEGGSELGHYVRTPWEGGGIQDLTPGMPNYAATYRMALSSDSSTFAFTPTGSEGASFWTLGLQADGTIGQPKQLFHSPKPLDDATLSPDGSIAVVATCQRSAARQSSTRD